MMGMPLWNIKGSGPEDGTHEVEVAVPLADGVGALVEDHGDEGHGDVLLVIPLGELVVERGHVVHRQHLDAHATRRRALRLHSPPTHHKRPQ